MMLDTLFRNTLTPWQWSLMAAVPAVIFALYFLKLKRVPVEVPSTYLWRKSIEDLRVNSLWQRLRKSVLLLLQLLVAALAALALVRPGWEGAELSGQRFIFLVDNSASMSSRDVEGEANRLAAAKRQVAGLIEQMEPGMTAMLVSFAQEPRVVQEFTGNTRLLLDRLESIAPTHEGTDLLGALKLADGLANPAQQVQEGTEMTFDVTEGLAATLFILSDGRFADVTDFMLGNLTPVYVPIGSTTADNLAITALAARRNEARPEQREVFAQVSNATEQVRRVSVELKFNGALVDARRIEVPAGGAAGAVFPLPEGPGGELVATLAPESLRDAKDALELDNSAYAVSGDPDPGRVLLVSEGNFAIESALGTGRAERVGGVETLKPSALEDKGFLAEAEAGAFDLVIFDRCAPKVAPRSNTLYVGALPPGPIWQEGVEQQTGKTATPQIIDWSRSHPLMANVDLSGVSVVESLILPTPRGGTSLADSTAGPLLVIAPRESFEDAVLGFDILTRDGGGQAFNTNWPKSHSFPTFWLNALDYFVARSRGEAGLSVKPGAAVELDPPGVLDSITVTGPGGMSRSLSRRGADPFLFQETENPGAYLVTAGGKQVERFAVNLFDRAESDIRVRGGGAQLPAAITIGNTAVGAEGLLPQRQELWPLLIAGALLLLLAEWYVYNRRVFL